MKIMPFLLAAAILAAAACSGTQRTAAEPATSYVPAATAGEASCNSCPPSAHRKVWYRDYLYR